MILDFGLILILIFIGFNLKFVFKKELNPSDYRSLNYLWIYHVSFGLIYWFYVSYVSGGDAILYYDRASSFSFSEIINNVLTEGPGTEGMILIASVPSKALSFLGTSIFFSLIGYIGIIFVYLIFIKFVDFNSSLFRIKLFPAVLFLPNLHFWSAGLGKDTISFMCICMFIYAMQDLKNNIFKILLALTLTYLIRPHISVFLIASFGLALLMDGDLKAYKKIFLMGIFIIAFAIFFNKFMSFINLDNLDFNTIETYSDKSTSNLSKSTTGSSVDVSSYPYPLKVFTFLYRPLFFDINNSLAVIASFENLFLLILSLKFLISNPLKMYRKSDFMFKGMFIFFLMGSLTFSLILGNLGIMLREKNMFMPSLLFLCLWSFSYKLKVSATK